MKPCVILGILSVVAGMKTAEPCRRALQLVWRRTHRGSSWVRLGGRISVCILPPRARGGALAGHSLQYQRKCARRGVRGGRGEAPAAIGTGRLDAGLNVGLSGDVDAGLSGGAEADPSIGLDI